MHTYYTDVVWNNCYCSIRDHSIDTNSRGSPKLQCHVTPNNLDEAIVSILVQCSKQTSKAKKYFNLKINGHSMNGLANFNMQRGYIIKYASNVELSMAYYQAN